MKKSLIVLLICCFILGCAHTQPYEQEYDINKKQIIDIPQISKFNPDGEIKSLIHTFGFSVGNGNIEDRYILIHKSEEFDLSSFSLFYQLTFPVSKKATFFFNIQHESQDIELSKIYNESISHTRFGLYLKIFSK